MIAGPTSQAKPALPGTASMSETYLPRRNRGRRDNRPLDALQQTSAATQ